MQGYRHKLLTNVYPINLFMSFVSYNNSVIFDVGNHNELPDDQPRKFIHMKSLQENMGIYFLNGVYYRQSLRAF